MHTSRYHRGVCSKANIINVGREGNWTGWNKCKNVANSIEVYNIIFNPHIQSPDKVRTLPKYRKYALVTPIHKGGDKCNTTNYRPISILPIISKILERWVHSVVYSHLDECNLIPGSQSGFRPIHSTETTLHDLTNTCYQAMERGEMTGTVFFL